MSRHLDYRQASAVSECSGGPISSGHGVPFILPLPGQVSTPSRVVARLSFGFWVSLVGAGGRLDLAGGRACYEMTLWRPALRRAFSHRTVLTRIAAYQPLNALRKLRNQIAHHEPIFARQLVEDHERILEVTGWMSPGARAWVEGRSRVPVLLGASNQATAVAG